MADENEFSLTDDNLREIFALFSSPTEEEKDWAYDKQNRSFFKEEDLDEEYSLTEEKREFAIDAWRAVSYFLYRNGFALQKNQQQIDLLRASGYRS